MELYLISLGSCLVLVQAWDILVFLQCLKLAYTDENNKGIM